MIRRSSRLFLEFLAALLAGIVVLAGFAAWRLSGDQPVRLTFLTPYIEESLTPPDKSFTVSIDDTVISWGGWQHTLDLRATGVRVRDVDGRTVATVPAISLTFSIRALVLHGLVAPTAITIDGPHIFLVRDTDGHFRFVHAAEPDSSEAGNETSPILPTLIETLSSKPDPASRAGYLSHASVTHGAVTFIDKKTGLTWRAPDANIALARRGEGVFGQLNLTVERLGNPAKLDMAIVYDSGMRTLSVTSNFTGVDASAVGQMDPVLARFAGAQLTLSGKLVTTLDLDGRIGATSFDVSGGPGTLAMPDVLEVPLPVKRVALRAGFDPVADRLTIDQAELESDGPHLSVTGTFDGIHAGFGGAASDLRIAAKATVDNVDMATLSRYWPIGARRKTRTWITGHVTEGHVTHIEANLGLTFPGGDPDKALVQQLTGTMRGDGLTVHYLDPLPVAEGAAGEAHFTQKTFTVDFTAGHVQDIQIDGGTLQVTGLDQPDQLIDIEGDLHGPLAAAFAVLDNPRLGYITKLGLSPTGVAGTAKAKLTFSFPAIHDLSFEQVKMGAAADIKGAHVAKAMLGQDLDDGDVTLKLDGDGMTMAGAATLGGAPVRFQWEENFGKAAFARRITASARTTADQRAAVGFDYRPTLDGPVDADVVFTQLAKQRSTIDLKLGLADATLQLAPLHWQKAAGTPGTAHAALELSGDHVVAIPDFSITTADLSASGKAAFNGDGSLSQAQFDHLQIGKTDLQGATVGFAGQRTDVVVTGGTVDAGPFIKKDDKDKKVPGADATTAAFSFRAPHLDRILVDADDSLTDVSLTLRRDARYWDEISLQATLPEKQDLSVSYKPDNGKHKLSIRTADAGAMLRTFDIIDTVKGGRLSITGEADDSAANRPLVGTAVIKDFRLVRAPILARLLTMATLTGFVDILTGEGFEFDRFDSDFTKTNGRLAFQLARAHGPSIGLTGTGYLDFDTDNVSVAGTVVPAYAVNSLLGNIPLIGDLLNGGEGKGLFAATYHATGSIESPQFSVNPLAALAPGFLRGMFEIFDSSDGQQVPVPLPSALPDQGSSK